MSNDKFCFVAMTENLKGNTKSTVSGECLDGFVRTLTFNDVYILSSHLANWIIEEIKQKKLTLVFYSQNSLDWLIWDVAAIIANTPMLVLNDDVKDTFFSNNSYLENIDKYYVVSSEKLSNVSGRSICASLDFNLNLGLRSACHSQNLNFKRDIFSYVYSSGSSGKTKGLVISRKGVENLISEFIYSYSLCESDSTLIFLPLSNFQQRSIVYGCFYVGASVSLSHISKMYHAVKKECPTFMVAPPVVFEGYLSMSNRTGAKLNDLLGGKIRFLITGMAPIEVKLLLAFQSAGLKLYEAYGMTEVGMISWNSPEYCRIGTVGKPVAEESVKITDDSEVIVYRNKPLCLGYFSQDLEKDTFGSDGGIRTGDMARFNSDGSLVLLGRKKNVIISSAGKKYCAEYIESQMRNTLNVLHAYLINSPDSNAIYCYLAVAPDAAQSFLDDMYVRAWEFLRKEVPGVNVQGVNIDSRVPSLEDNTLTKNLKPNRSMMLSVYFK